MNIHLTIDNYSGRLRIRIIPALALTLIMPYCYSQQAAGDSLLVFSGRVYHAGDSSILSNVHIINLSKHTGTVSAPDDSFLLHVRDRDSIRFSCIGFSTCHVVINALVLRPGLMVFMQPDTIMMDELTVYPFPPRRYFKQVFLDTKVPDEHIPDLRFAGIRNDPAYVPATGLITSGPVQLLYDRFNRQARTRRKLKNNREKYSKYLLPVSGDSLVFPGRPE